jgi:hypothetical protein
MFSGQFNNHFTSVIYSPGKIICTVIHCIHAPMQCFQNALAYFATGVSYACKMFIKLTPGANVIKLLMTVSYKIFII